jgi:hypothetical protein
MHAKDAPFGEPPLAFLLDESLNPVGSDELQVFDLAHAIFQAIALIEMPQVVAREFRACAAKSAGALATNA